MLIISILDGWGIGALDDSNPLYVADTKWLGYFTGNYPSGALKAHGLLIGTAWREAGGSELGHLTIGAGRSVEQNESKTPLPNTLVEVLTKNQKSVLKIAESKKEESVTTYLNGFHTKPFEGEFRAILPSENSPRPQDHPAMRATALTDRAIASINEGGFDVIVINYANPDVIAQTADFEGTRLAAEALDKELGRLYENAKQKNATIIITSSHGNAEVILDPTTGKPQTKNDPNPVPFHLIGTQYQKPQNKDPYASPQTIGLLQDVAPTILELTGLKTPNEMTGESLLSQLT